MQQKRRPMPQRLAANVDTPARLWLNQDAIDRRAQLKRRFIYRDGRRRCRETPAGLAHRRDGRERCAAAEGALLPWAKARDALATIEAAALRAAWAEGARAALAALQDGRVPSQQQEEPRRRVGSDRLVGAVP